MQPQLFHVEKNFYQGSKDLRGYFEKQFANPRQTQAERFVWDYWHVRDQYCQMRTPAYHYFPEKIYYPFHEKLVRWGRENLGCHDVSPPWLSYYVNGHFQNLHSDMPHGPWAFVYSLSPKKIKFSGGQTLLMKESTLDFWNHAGVRTNEHEISHFFHEVTPHFGQLLIFDSRIPHAVKEVKNILDPLDARLVIHGWFVEPRPYVVGGLKTNQVTKIIDQWLPELQTWLHQQPELHGCLTIKMQISKTGQVQSFNLLTNTIRQTNKTTKNQPLFSFLKTTLTPINFPKSKTSSQLIIPLLFK